MSIAEKIVNRLLEQTTACAACEKETGQPSQPGASHGYCKRHLIGMYQQMLEYPKGRANAEAKIAQIQQRPDSDFPPDLSRQRSAQV